MKLKVERVAKGLGWFSIGLGLAEMVAPYVLSRSLGMRQKHDLVRGYGAREIATGAAILASKNPAPWLWARVAGDSLDLATLLTPGLTATKSAQRNIALALVSVGGVTVIDFWCARKLSRKNAVAGAAMKYDYSDRSGFPKQLNKMPGAAVTYLGDAKAAKKTQSR